VARIETTLTILMEIDARYFGRGATLRLLVRYFNNPRLERFLSCSRRGAPPGRQPPFGWRNVAKLTVSCQSSRRNAYQDHYSPAFASSQISHPLSHRLPLRVGFRRGIPRRDRTGLLSSAFLSIVNDLGSSFSPTAVPVCRADMVTSRTDRIPFGPSVSRRSEFQHLSLVCIDEVYQNFTCVCRIVPA